MKKLLSLSLITAVCVVFAVSSWANQASIEIVSDSNTKFIFYGFNGQSYPVEAAPGLPSGWNSDSDFVEAGWSPAILYQHTNYFEPTLTPPFDSTGAEWVGASNPNDGSDKGNRGIYLYRQSLPLPATAHNVSGQAAIGADNYGWLYINGIQVLEPNEKSQDDRNFMVDLTEGYGPSIGSIPTDLEFTCDNVLAAEVQNGCGDCNASAIGSDGANGPEGVIFSLHLDYEVPDVVWQPPVTNQDGFALKDGTTLPLKFKLYTQDGYLITGMQNLYVQVIEGEDVTGAVVAGWSLGEGVDNMRFDLTEYYYICNFKSKNYELVDGALYTAFVQDGCSDQVLGSVDFIMNASTGTGRGKNK